MNVSQLHSYDTSLITKQGTMHVYFKQHISLTFKPFSVLESIATKQSFLIMVSATKHLLLNVIV